MTQGLSDYQDQIDTNRQTLQDDGVLIGDSMDTQSFDELNAEIQRKSWDQFAENDIPYILDYSYDLVSGKHRERAIEQAKDGVNKGFGLSQATSKRRTSDLGLDLSSHQKNDRQSDFQRNKTKSLIDAQNKASRAGIDRENSLLAGTQLPNVGGDK